MDQRLTFGLLHNALDYLLSAAEHARSDSPRSWKYGVLHLGAAIELLLKARLEKEHWSLLFADIDKADYQALRSGDFRSVDFQGACNRLRNIAGIKINDSQLRHLDELRKLRNQIQHFAVDVDLEQTKSLVAKGTSFFLEFFQANLPDDLAGHTEMLGDIHAQLREFEQFVEARLADIQAELAVAATCVDCPRCWQITVVLGNGDPHCLFCGFSVLPHEFREYVGEGSVDDECLECGQRTLSFVLYHNEFGVDYCVSCGSKQTTCLRCRNRSVGENQECPRCGYSP